MEKRTFYSISIRIHLAIGIILFFVAMFILDPNWVWMSATALTAIAFFRCGATYAHYILCGRDGYDERVRQSKIFGILTFLCVVAFVAAYYFGLLIEVRCMSLATPYLIAGIIPIFWLGIGANMIWHDGGGNHD